MNIHLFFGEDNYSASEKLKFWQQEFIKKYGEDSIEIIEGAKLKPAEFNTNIEALPFLSEKRLIIVKNFLEKTKAEEQKSVADHLENSTESCIVIFFEDKQVDKRLSLYKKIAKIGQLHEFAALTNIQISKWIIDQSQKIQIQITPPLANYLAEYSSPNLWILAKELEKLKFYTNGQMITKTMIEEIVTPSLTSSIFKLTDLIAEKKSREAIRILEILKESGEELSKIFYMIVRHFRILIQVNELLSKKENPFEIAKKLKQHPFVIQKTGNQSKNFNFTKLAQIYRQMLEIDIRTKSGTIRLQQNDQRALQLAIEQLILDCCR